MEKKKFSILPIFFTVFLDLLGLGIVIPILPAVLFDPFGGILSANVSMDARKIIYGFLVASYPLAQFFGAPMLGVWADKFGRKKLLSISLVGTLLGYIIFAIGILQQNIFLLFAGRILDGFTGGNISIAQSSIADISDEKSKAKNFGLIGMAFGLGFVIGPYIGGKLADPSIVSWFDYTTPFWFAAILSSINILLVLWRFQETLRTKTDKKVNPFTGVQNIYKAFTMTNIRMIFLIVFLLTVGFNFFTQFFQVFLFEKYHYTQSQVGDFFAYMGLWIAFAQGAIVRPISKKQGPKKILSYSILLLGVTLPMLLIPDKVGWLYVIIPLIAIFQGLVQPNTTAIVSGSASPETQGEILGINQSIQSLGQAIPPILAGFGATYSINMPTLFAGFTTIVAWMVFIRLYRRENKLQEVEA